MATKARYLKTPIQLWVADNRKRLGLTPADLAAWTGVTEDTARGWESRGAPSQDAIEELTRRFGQKPPTTTSSAGERDTLPAELVSLMEAQTEAIMSLALELRADREERMRVRQEFADAVTHNDERIRDLNAAVSELALRLQRVEGREEELVGDPPATPAWK